MKVLKRKKFIPFFPLDKCSMTSVIMKKMKPSETMTTRLLVTRSHSKGERILSNFPVRSIKDNYKKTTLQIITEVVLSKINIILFYKLNERLESIIDSAKNVKSENWLKK